MDYFLFVPDDHAERESGHVWKVRIFPLYGQTEGKPQMPLINVVFDPSGAGFTLYFGEKSAYALFNHMSLQFSPARPEHGSKPP